MCPQFRPKAPKPQRDKKSEKQDARDRPANKFQNQGEKKKLHPAERGWGKTYVPPEDKRKGWRKLLGKAEVKKKRIDRAIANQEKTANKAAEDPKFREKLRKQKVLQNRKQKRSFKSAKKYRRRGRK